MANTKYIFFFYPYGPDFEFPCFMTGECTDVMEENITSKLKVQFQFSRIHMWVVRSSEMSEWLSSTKRKLKTRNYRLIHKFTEDTENLILNFWSILMEFILNFNKHTFSLVPHIFDNKRVSINLQWIMIYSQYCCEGTLVSLAVT